MKKEKTLADFQMHRENPFAKQTIVQMGNYLSTRQVVGKNDDERSVLQAVDGNGRLLGQTVFMRTMFLRLCGPPSIPLSFTVAGVLPRWDA